jgi:hypothetical protein
VASENSDVEISEKKDVATNPYPIEGEAAAALGMGSDLFQKPEHMRPGPQLQVNAFRITEPEEKAEKPDPVALYMRAQSDFIQAQYAYLHSEPKDLASFAAAQEFYIKAMDAYLRGLGVI